MLRLAAWCVVAATACSAPGEAPGSGTSDAGGPSAASALEEALVSSTDTFAQITGAQYDTVYLPEEYGGQPYAGPCPVGWPVRVEAAMGAAGVTPLTESCRGVVEDFNGDALPDAVATATISGDTAVVLILDGPTPEVLTVAPWGPSDVLMPMQPGRRELSGCFPGGVRGQPQQLTDRVRDFPDGELSFSHPGFSISFDEKITYYYHLESDGLHEEEGSGC